MSSKPTGVRPMIETYPLEKAAEAYARMMSVDAQFVVTTCDNGRNPSGGGQKRRSNPRCGIVPEMTSNPDASA
jgi:hypothetical protein